MSDPNSCNTLKGHKREAEENGAKLLERSITNFLQVTANLNKNVQIQSLSVPDIVLGWAVPMGESMIALAQTFEENPECVTACTLSGVQCVSRQMQLVASQIIGFLTGQSFGNPLASPVGASIGQNLALGLILRFQNALRKWQASNGNRTKSPDCSTHSCHHDHHKRRHHRHHSGSRRHHRHAHHQQQKPVANVAVESVGQGKHCLAIVSTSIRQLLANYLTFVNLIVEFLPFFPFSPQTVQNAINVVIADLTSPLLPWLCGPPPETLTADVNKAMDAIATTVAQPNFPVQSQALLQTFSNSLAVIFLNPARAVSCNSSTSCVSMLFPPCHVCPPVIPPLSSSPLSPRRQEKEKKSNESQAENSL